MTSVHGVTSSQVTHPGEHGSHTSCSYYRHSQSTSHVLFHTFFAAG